MAIRIIRKKGILLLGIWVILQGLIQALEIPAPLGPSLSWAAAILAVVAGVLLILDM